jgi:RNA polymerase sigma-70 factor (ECF subfamily)
MTDKQGDDAEFCEFYAQTSRALWAYLSRASGNNPAADDLLQESYLRYLQSGWRNISPDERRFYLFRIATNLLHDHFRRQQRIASTMSEERAPSTGPGMALRLDVAGIMRNDMTARGRELLWLAHAEEFTHREIAQMIDLQEASIRPMLFRARQKMAAFLKAAGYGREGRTS